MDTMTIDYTAFPYPSKFTMVKAPNIVCEYTTMGGDIRADVNGFRWEDTTLEWSSLEQSDLSALSAIADQHTFDIQFKDATQQVKTVTAINRGMSFSKMRYLNNGNYVFEDVKLALTFPEVFS